jgi:hypothetical protein
MTMATEAVQEMPFAGFAPAQGEFPGEVTHIDTPLPAHAEGSEAESQGIAFSKESIALKALKGVAIINEMLPTDDAMRYSLLIASQVATHNPLVGAAVLGASTLAVEGSAVLASYKWVAEDRIKPVIDKVRDKIDGFKEALNRLVPRIRPGRAVPNIPEDPEVGSKLPVTIQAAIALNLGSVVLLEAQQRRDPTRTAEQARKDGLRSAVLVSGYMAVEGALLSTGFNNLTNPLYVSLAAVGIAGLHYGVHRIRQRNNRGELHE